MIFYRIKQFYWVMQSRIIKDDFKMLNIYLNESELKLFMKISKSERQHSIRVCKAAIKYIENKNLIDVDKYKMCKCALLHDIGKSKAKLNTFYKSFFVIANSITCGKFIKYNKNKKIINYYNHASIGASLLENINEADLEIIHCIRYHHKYEWAEKNIYLEILTICDNSN